MATAIAVPNSVPHLLFLIGGPGGGKSRAASGLVAELGEPREGVSGLAQRRYTYEGGSRSLVLINDATIDAAVTARSGSSGLVADLEEVLATGAHLIACVNRGVLVDEMSRYSGAGQAAELLAWLGAGGNDEPERGGEYLLQRDYMDGEALVATVTAVFVDVCSLLERKPVTVSGPTGLECEGYRVMPFRGGDRVSTPAGRLLSDAVAGFDWQSDAHPSLDPIRANIDSLSDHNVLRGLLSLLRASEIVAGQRFTYRELWGCAGRVIAGELPRLVRASEAASSVAVIAASDGDRPTFAHMRELARHRWFVSIFGGLDPEPDVSSADPVLKLTSRADPLLDASPLWATPVTDAFASSVLSSSPLEMVTQALGDMLNGAVQAFDVALDTAFLEFTQSAVSHNQRAEAEAWYGRYLTRLYAAAQGVPAFDEVVQEWVETYTLGAVSDALAPLLRTMLSPRRYANSQDASPLVPLYASRTDPLLGYAERPILARRSEPFQFVARREGEELRLVVKEEGEVVGDVLLDFDLVREAMTCSHDWLGMTEASDHTSPRVERLRSKRLTSEALSRNPRIAVAIGDEDFLVTVDVPS